MNSVLSSNWLSRFTKLISRLHDLLLNTVTFTVWLTLISGSTSAFSESEAFTPGVFFTNLDRPEAVVPLSGNSVLVGERSGDLVVLTRNHRVDLGPISLPDTHIFYVPQRPYTEGLKDLIAVPSQPGVYMWCMTTGQSQQIRWSVGRAEITMDERSPAMKNEIIWQSDLQPWTRGSIPPFSGCRMAIQGGDLFVAMGANSRATGSGKIMRIFMTGISEPRVVSTGHRNPSGLVFRSGLLWEVEHGPRGGDELNIIIQGSNYGWPDVSSGDPDDGEHPRGFLRHRPGSTDPVVTWTPAIAPSSIARWRGKLYVGALKGTEILELTVKGDRVISQRPLLRFDDRIRDVRVGIEDECLWVLTDGPEAKLLRVTLNPNN